MPDSPNSLSKSNPAPDEGTFSLVPLLQRRVEHVRQVRDFLSDFLALHPSDGHIASASPALAVAGAVPTDEKVDAFLPMGDAAAKGASASTAACIARKPMRPPRAGTTRSLIYSLLSESAGRHFSRSEIVAEIARLRGVPKSLCRKGVVGVIENDYDPHIRKVDGNYAYRAAGATPPNDD